MLHSRTLTSWMRSILPNSDNLHAHIQTQGLLFSLGKLAQPLLCLGKVGEVLQGAQHLSPEHMHMRVPADICLAPCRCRCVEQLGKYCKELKIHHQKHMCVPGDTFSVPRHVG